MHVTTVTYNHERKSEKAHIQHTPTLLDNGAPI